jgi:plastocyanin
MTRHASFAFGLLVALAATTTLPAQEPAKSPTEAMQRLAEATTAAGKAIEARDRAALAAPLAALRNEVAALQKSPLSVPHQDVANAALAELALACADLAAPVGDGSASDPFDFARLRRACTQCHLGNRDRNDERGLFPNRDNAVRGVLRVEERDGTARESAAGVVLFLEGEQEKARPQPRMPTISQKGRRFDPPLLVVTTGTVVAFPNDDVVFHNVFSLSRGNAFDLGTYGKGTAKERAFASPGLVKVHCNIHPEMVSHVLVLETSLTAISDAGGRFTLTDVPDGKYVLRLWHPLADEQRHQVEVARGRLRTVDPLVVRETKPRAPHNNKHGRPYPENY